MRLAQGRGLGWTLAGVLWAVTVCAYEVPLLSEDPVRQVCSGMWGSTRDRSAFIEVIFSGESINQAAMVIYEGADAKYLGVDVSNKEAPNDWSEERLYVCTLEAVKLGACTVADVGQFLITRTNDTETSIFTTSVIFDAVPGSETASTSSAGPYRYDVKKTGYYCVGVVPLTADDDNSSNNVVKDSFYGVVDFQNIFDGHLPASVYPKIAFYFYLFMYYIAVGVAWGVLLFRNRGDVLPIQHYVTGTIALLVVEYVVMWLFYSYQNANATPGGLFIMLVAVAVLSSGRNAMSFFLLLITSMGYGVTRPSLGGVMIKVRLLALIHFAFGVLYILAAEMTPLEQGGLTVFLFILPLAFTLTAFLMWIIWSLNSTIADLGMRKQAYKKSMFVALYRILACVVAVITAFFIVTFVTFRNRLNSGFIPSIWKIRWILTDGWLGILYAVAFTAIAFLWRPAGHNRRLALSDELPMDETDAEAYDIDSIARRASKDVDHRRSGDHVVFDVGDDDEDDDSGDDEGRNREKSHHVIAQSEEDVDDRTPLKQA